MNYINLTNINDLKNLGDDINNIKDMISTLNIDSNVFVTSNGPIAYSIVDETMYYVGNNNEDDFNKLISLLNENDNDITKIIEDPTEEDYMNGDFMKDTYFIIGKNAKKIKK